MSLVTTAPLCLGSRKDGKPCRNRSEHQSGLCTRHRPKTKRRSKKKGKPAVAAAHEHTENDDIANEDVAPADEQEGSRQPDDLEVSEEDSVINSDEAEEAPCPQEELGEEPGEPQSPGPSAVSGEAVAKKKIRRRSSSGSSKTRRPWTPVQVRLRRSDSMGLSSDERQHLVMKLFKSAKEKVNISVLYERVTKTAEFKANTNVWPTLASFTSWLKVPECCVCVEEEHS